MKRKYFAFLVIVIVAFAGCAAPTPTVPAPTPPIGEPPPALVPPTEGTVTGTISTSDGAPVVDATVSIAGCQTTTEENGEFVIEGIPQGEYELEIVIGELFLPIATEVTGGETTKLSLMIDTGASSLKVGISSFLPLDLERREVGDSYDFEAVVWGGQSPYTYTWTFGDGVTSSEPMPSHTYVDEGAYTVGVLIIDAAGSTAHDEASITIHEALAPLEMGIQAYFDSEPLEPVDFSTGETSVVDALPEVMMTLDFAAAVTGGQEPYCVTWGFGDEAYAGSEVTECSANTGLDVSHTYELSGYYTVVAIVSDALGNEAYDTFPINLDGLLPYPEEAMVTDAGVFPEVGQPGDDHHYWVSAQLPPATWQGASWDFHDGTKLETRESTATHSFVSPGDYDVSPGVDYEKADGTSHKVNGDSIHTESCAVLQVSIKSDATLGCPGPLNFEAEAKGGCPPLTYFWQFGDGKQDFGKSVNHSYEKCDNYTVSLTVADKKGNMAGDSLKLLNPKDTLGVSGSTCYYTWDPMAITVTVQVHGGCPPYDILIDYGDPKWSKMKNERGRLEARHQYEEKGTYQIGVTVSDACGESDTIAFPPFTVPYSD